MPCRMPCFLFFFEVPIRRRLTPRGQAMLGRDGRSDGAALREQRPIGLSEGGWKDGSSSWRSRASTIEVVGSEDVMLFVARPSRVVSYRGESRRCASSLEHRARWPRGRRS